MNLIPHNKNVHSKIIDSIKNMIIVSKYSLPYYGEFNLHINFKRSDSLPTCGVNVSSKGMNFYWNQQFLDEMDQKQVNFVVLHETFHLIFNHPRRTVTGQYDPKLANIAQDMIINHIIWDDINHDFVDIPKYADTEENRKFGSVDKNMALFVPKEYNGRLIFEDLYMWLRDKNDEYQNKQNQKSQEKSSDGDGQPDYGPYGKDPHDENGSIDSPSLDSIFKNMEKNDGQWMDSHIGDEVPEEYRDTIVKDIMDKLKARGLQSGSAEKTIGKLRKKRKDYLKEIKRSISNDIVGHIKTRTIIRPSRRGIFGVKGHKKITSKINVILDTSGSMTSEFERVLSYIYRHDIEINLIQCDTHVKSVATIKNKRSLEILKIKGLGGTTIQPAFNLVTDKYNMYNTVLLTDGATDSLDFSKVSGKTLIISSGKACPVSVDNGKIKQIVIEKTK